MDISRALDHIVVMFKPDQVGWDTLKIELLSDDGSGLTIETKSCSSIPCIKSTVYSSGRSLTFFYTEFIKGSWRLSKLVKDLESHGNSALTHASLEDVDLEYIIKIMRGLNFV